MILSFVLFLICIFSVFYLPGRFVVSKTGYVAAQTLSQITVSLATGIALFLIGTYIFAWFNNASFIYLILISPIVLWEFFHFLRDFPKNKQFGWILSWETLIIVCGILCILSVTAKSGAIQHGTLNFYGLNARDGIFNMALVVNAIFHFPLAYPGLSNTQIHGYHILYDFMVSRFALIFGFSPFDLFFRFFPFFLALFLGLSATTASFDLKMSPLGRRIFLFLLYFVQGIQFFLFHWFAHGNGDIIYDSPIVQTVGNIIDPSVPFSASFIFLLSGMLFATKNRRQLLLPILFLGVLPGIKIYSGILGYAAAGVVTLFGILHKKYHYLVILIFAAIISAAVYIPFNIGAGSLIFAPFLVVSHFFEGQHLFAPFQWPLKLQVYEQHHNIPRIIYLYAIALAALWIPALGIRLVSLVAIKKLFSKKFYTPYHIFWTTLFVVGILAPLFVIQSVGVFNIVQFYWITWIFLVIPTTYGLLTILGKPAAVKVALLFVILIALSFPTLFYPSYLRLTQDQLPTLAVNQDLLTTAHVIHNLDKKSQILVVNRIQVDNEYQDIFHIPLVGTISERPMFYEPQLTDYALAVPIENQRRAAIEKISMLITSCPGNADKEIVAIMRSVTVQYLLLLNKSSCLDSGLLRKYTQHGDYTLYSL